MKRNWRLLVALLALLGLVAAACGDSDDSSDSGTATTAAPAAEDDSAADEDMADEDMADEEMADEDMADEEMADEDMADEEMAEEMVDLSISLIHNGRGDGSFNDAAVVGYDQALDRFGITQTEVVVNLTGGETGATEVETVASTGTQDLNIGIGFLLGDAITAASAAFPDQQFAIVDSVVDAPNVKGLVFAEEQGSYLVGAAAALTSTSGTIGFIGGVETDLIKKFEAGFIAGAEAVNPDINIVSNYITQPPDFSGFGDPTRGKEIAIAQLEQGADVIYHAAGGSGNGMFEAVKEANEDGTTAWGIGVDSDQADPANVGVPDEVKPYILTSMLKRVDVAVLNTITDLHNGDFEPGGVTLFDLSVDGVGYSTTGDHLSADIVAQLEDFKAQIISGAITVPTAP